jgi:hypothetical protein
LRLSKGSKVAVIGIVISMFGLFVSLYFASHVTDIGIVYSFLALAVFFGGEVVVVIGGRMRKKDQMLKTQNISGVKT